MPNLQFRALALKALTVMLAVLFATPLAAERSHAHSSPPPTKAESLAVWTKIATVLQHPRCLNCHQAESPLQGDARRPHMPHVVRGPDSHGVGAMRCGNCHNETGNNLTSRTPGAPRWSLAPISMLWQGLSVGDLCRSLRDPKHNGNRSAQRLQHG